LQAFYLLEELTIDGLTAEGDGTSGPPNDGACYTSGECDVVGAFIDRDGVEVCVAWGYADGSADFTYVALMGDSGADDTGGYLLNGESAYLKVYDASNGSILSVIPGEALPGFYNNGIFVIAGTSTAWNGGVGCTNSGACNYDAEAIHDDGSCLYYDCTGECGGSAVVDECGVCDGGNDGTDCNEDGIPDDCEEVYDEGYTTGLEEGILTGAQSGDISGDGELNILDIIIFVEMILNP
jgi:hypothetical protein